MSFIKRVYKMFKKQVTIIKEYIKNMLKKNYIRSSISLYVTLVLIIKKFDNDLRICVDYRMLNALIIRNRNILLLIRDTLTKLYMIK